MLIPQIGVITDFRTETHDVKTFRIAGNDGMKPFGHMPGQCAMLSVPGVGEAMFSICAPPADDMEFSVKAVGTLTNYMHRLEPGAQLTVRGPYGRAFPMDEMTGQNLLFIAGGIGLAPLRSVIKHVFHNRENYGYVDILYGARSAADLVYRAEIEERWMTEPGTSVYLTVDREEDGWGGHVGFVPSYLTEIGFDSDKTVMVCGPPVMIKYTLAALLDMGFKKEQVYTTLELRMKCGVGKCGRCNIGPKFVCKDGPVFRCDELDALPDEY